ncbi:hypothetical protein AHAS_Ahas09G0196500 [Arachis hypogaea]
MSVEGEENRQKFKRTFVIFIQKCFLLPTTVKVASPIHKPPIFHVENIQEWDWPKHVLNFLMKGTENKRKGTKQSIDGCVFVLMLIYFHKTKFPRPFGPDAPPESWVAHWTKQKMLDQISREATDPLKQQLKMKALQRIQKAKVNPKTKKKKLKKVAQRKENNHRRLMTVNLRSELLLKTQGSSTPSVNAQDNTSIPWEPQQQPNKEPPAQQTEQQKQATKESSPRNTEPEPSINVCPPKQQQQQQAQSEFSPAKKQQQPRQKEDDMPSFSLGISPPASQPTHPSELPILQLEILTEVVVDAGVTATLKFAEATFSEPTLPAAEVFKTLEKKIKISKELIEKCYHWMTHVKTTKDSSNEYDTIFVLKDEALYEGLREYFVSLMPKEQNFMLGTHGVDYTDKRTNKAYRFDIEQYAHQRQFLEKRKLASHPFLFVPICNGVHWWLWIADVNKKKFYVLDLINKVKKDISESRVKLNKFVMRVYDGAESLMEDGLGEEAKYMPLNGQRTNYDCGIYVMKWLETIDPQKIKSERDINIKFGHNSVDSLTRALKLVVTLFNTSFAWRNNILVDSKLITIYSPHEYCLEEIDDFRYQYGPNLLVHKMNKIRDQVIWESEAIRLPKSSAIFSSSYCKFTYGDLDSK